MVWPPASAQQVPNKRKKRRFGAALSLRTVMMLVLICGCWLAWKVNRARAVRHAIAVIERAGGTVTFGDESQNWGEKPWLAPPVRLVRSLGQEFFFDVVEIRVRNKERNLWTDEATRALEWSPSLKSFGLVSAKVDNDLIGGLAKLHQLRVIWMFSGSDQLPNPKSSGIHRLSALKKLQVFWDDVNSVTIEDLEALATLPDLRDLSLGARLTDKQLAQLGKFTRLESLNFHGSETLEGKRRETEDLPIKWWQNLRELRISSYTPNDEDYKALSELPKLEKLHLHDAGAEDKDLEQFARIKGRKVLYFGSRFVTKEGLDRLKQRLPNTSIDGGPKIGRKL